MIIYLVYSMIIYLVYNILSKCLQKMKKSNKSLVSKKGSCLSFYTGSCRDESSLQLMRISLKKEIDRRERLQKLLQKYENIRASEKIHIKSIKASIIELKDVQVVPKIHFLVDPNIYVDNNLSIETREFLCMLLNTFYKRYQENKKYELQTAKINENIKSLIKNISNNEELLFKVQKTNINKQVQLEGELLSQRNKLKEETQKSKELQNEEKRVKTIWTQKKQIYQDQKRKVDALAKIMKEIEGKIVGLNQKISKGEEIRQGNQDKISGQIVYQMKFDQQVNKIRNGINSEISREAGLKKRIRQKQIKLDKLKGNLSYDKSRHQVELKLLDLQQPRPSTKLYGMGELLEMQRSFQKVRMSRTQATNYMNQMD